MLFDLQNIKKPNKKRLSTPPVLNLNPPLVIAILFYKSWHRCWVCDPNPDEQVSPRNSNQMSYAKFIDTIVSIEKQNYSNREVKNFLSEEPIVPPLISIASLHLLGRVGRGGVASLRGRSGSAPLRTEMATQLWWRRLGTYRVSSHPTAALARNVGTRSGARRRGEGDGLRLKTNLRCRPNFRNGMSLSRSSVSS